MAKKGECYMAIYNVITKNQIDIDKKARVYFTCHPDDFDKYFDKICKDVFKTHDCAIYYTEDMTEVIADEEKEVNLARSNLFVVPVTLKLLSVPNRAMDNDIPYAFQKHIPVLPVMMEEGLDELYSQKNKFGEVQYLNSNSIDLTEISYEDKLKKYLESVLISDELAQRVRAAFDAYIFLSYRKKDRKYANELMKLIHSNPQCRDIAIWFDEFLIPGESFKETIEKILDDCKLFTLLVTPQLLEKIIDENGQERDNYVISTELPLARKNQEEKGTDIFAVEMEKTDKNELKAININDFVNFKDEEFKTRLLASVSKIAVSQNNTPEHNFLIGMAYLDGIDVEVDRERGIELITSAAEAGLIEAMDELYKIYKEGIGSNIDYKKTAYWAKNIADYYTSEYGGEHVKTLTALGNLATAFGNLGEYSKALKLQEKVYNLRCTISGEEHPDTLTALNNLALTCSQIGHYTKALNMQEKVYSLRCKVSGEEHSDTLKALGNLALTHSRRGIYSKAMELQEKLYKIECNVLGEEHPSTITSLNNLATTHSRLEDHSKAFELQEIVYKLRCKILGEEHPNTLTTLNNLALTYGELGDNLKALELKEKVYKLRCKILGEEHPSTLTSLNNLAYTHDQLGDHLKSLELQGKAYKLRCKVLGEEHPNTLKSLNNLALTHSRLKDYSKAIELQETVYKLRCKVLGEEHPDTIRALSNLAFYYEKEGDVAAALTHYEKLFELQKHVYGVQHPKTKKNLAILEQVRSKPR